jgi:predicted protein tyrosine phosphatase
MTRRGGRSSLDLIFSTSRAGAETFSWPDPFAVISITDPGSQPVIFKQRNLIARCGLEFWDLLADPDDGRVIFDSEMARAVLNFIERGCGRAQLLLVHCEAGISRSTGLANALGRVLDVDVRHQNALFLNPNPLVMRLLLEEAERRKTVIS